MPYLRNEKPFARMNRLLAGYKFNGPKLAKVLNVSEPTAKKRLDNPALLTLEDLDRISRFGHVPIEELRDAIAR